MDGEAAAAIVLAGGSGSRVHPGANKLDMANKVYLPIGGHEMLSYSLETLDLSPLVDRLVVVIRDQDRSSAESVVARTIRRTPWSFAIGGANRHDSERAGLEALATEIESGAFEVVAIHDGARPFVTLDLLASILDTARLVGGAVPGSQPAQAIYERGPGVARLVPTEDLRQVQTPQAFSAKPLLEAYRHAGVDAHTAVDTAEMVGRSTDLDIELVEGDVDNIKVTFVEDFFAAENLARSWTNGRWKQPRP